MRTWDIPPEKLCRQHLLGEHRELHAIWSIITKKEGIFPSSRNIAMESEAQGSLHAA